MNRTLILSNLLALILAFFIAFVSGPLVLKQLRKLKGQQISEDAPERHRSKQGTPTMGGVLILGGMIPAALLVGGWNTLPALLVTLALGFVGGLDDYLSMRRGKNLGLKARQKMAMQIVIAFLFMVWLGRSEHSLGIWIPGLEFVELGWVYLLLGGIWIIGLSNAVNLSDGLDGLCGGLSAIAGVALGLALQGLVIPGGVSEGSSVVAFALAGGCLGFLWYNAHPALVFMGDTGSLALGGGLAALSLLGNVELPFFVMAGVFLAEAGSVMIQVAVFQTRKRRYGLEHAQKNRVFRRTPVHHHFEMGERPWAETQVVTRFWIAGALFAALGLAWAWIR
ncbi:MAG: phospho-N-acetylmuramoyl-pentapeptide-transferase [Armatimonadetes bacterium]|nr:phospho-N-acetylmuramoyl-pentapeptide-transferase [Armatimonadota bacterium]